MEDQNVLQFMMTLGNLKRNKRTGWVLRNVRGPESIADHMYRMGIFALLLDDKVLETGAEQSRIIDKTRCIKIALVHDMCEAIVGDITPHCMVKTGMSVEDKHRQEKEAMISMCQNLTKDVGAEIMALYEEYENQITLEAQTVKDLDRFEMILQAHEYELSEQRLDDPHFLQDFFESTEGKFKNPQVQRWVKSLTEMRGLNRGGPRPLRPDNLGNSSEAVVSESQK